MSIKLRNIIALLNDFINHKDFKKYWFSLNKESLDKDLKFFVNNYINSLSYKMTSRFWSNRNVKHLNLILKNKSERFDYEISTDYFTWDNFYNSRISSMYEKIFGDEVNQKIKIFKQQKNMTPYKSLQHNFLTLMLYQYMKKIDKNNIFEKIKNKDSFIWNNPWIEIDNFKISQDLITSTIEWYEIQNIFNLSNINSLKNPSILEIGAGNGRSADLFITLNDKCKYFICDIPIASFISYKRLNEAHSNKNIVCAYNVKNKEEMNNVISKNDIIFLLPHQISLIKNKSINLTLAFDCIHEMDKKTIKFYMKNINNFSNFFFMKVWEKTLVPFSFFNYLNVHNNSFFINEKWQQLEKKKSLFPSNFYNLSFKI